MKTYSLRIDPLTNEEYLEVSIRGEQVLHDPSLIHAIEAADALRVGRKGRGGDGAAHEDIAAKGHPVDGLSAHTGAVRLG